MRHLTKLRLTKFFRDKSEQSKLMEDLRRGVPLNAALLARRLPVNDGSALLWNQFGRELERALIASRLEMKKADKHLKEWGSSFKQEIGAEFR